MAITAGETLSLNSLGSATGQTEKSLSAAKGNTTGPIAMSSFGIDEVGSISGFTYAVENTNENYTLGFTGDGSNFSRISSRGANFTWSVPTGTKISLDTNSGATATFAVGNMTDVGTQTTLQGIETHTLRVVFADGFNDHATNYNTNRDKTVYSVDSYDGNSTALCLTVDSPVTLADGTTIEIGELSEGDKLSGFSIGGLGTDSDATFLAWSSSELLKTPKEVTVVNLTYSFASRYYDINNSDITATAEHPMLVKDSISGEYKFKEMFNLVVGDALIKGDGSEVDIFSIEVIEKTTEIVSIDVEEEDTYMVNGYITHNKGGNTHSDFSGPGAPTSVTYSSPLITWVAPSNTTTTGVTAYEYQISSASNFSSIENTADEWSTTEVEVNTILAAGTWYFRVRAIEAGLKGVYSSTLTFVR
jgi:hypothetical protein